MTDIAACISRNTIVDPTTGCWLWQRAIDKNGYGLAKIDGKMRRAHRVAFELLKAPLVAGLVLDHLCKNKRCINPEHLEQVTNAENMRRARKTHCKWGHPYDKRIARPGQSQPVCLICQREATRRWRLRTAYIT